MANETTKAVVLAETLRRAKELIDAPERWCQDVAVRHLGVDGTVVPWQRCATAAVMSVVLHGSTAYYDAIKALSRAEGGPVEGHAGPVGFVQRFNDAPGRTHAEVMAMYDRAIAAEEAKYVRDVQ